MAWEEPPRNQSSELLREAASAFLARSSRNWKNALLCPEKSPELVNPVTAAMAPPLAVDVGRITAQGGRLVLMNLHGLAIT